MTGDLLLIATPWRNTPGGLLLMLGVAVVALVATLRLREGISEGSPEERDRRFLRTIFAGGLALRAFVAFALRYTDYHFVIAPDELTFHTNGEMFRLWVHGWVPVPISPQHLGSWQVGYFYLVGGIYTVLGVEVAFPLLLNCLIGAATAWPVFAVAKDLKGRRAARLAAAIATFFPSLVLWSALLIRDTIVVAVLICLVLAVMRLTRGITLGRLLAFTGLLLALGTLRQYLFLMVALSAAAGLLFGRSKQGGRTLVAGLVGIVLLAGLMKATGLGGMEMERASLGALNQQRQFNAMVADAATSLRPEVDISTPSRALYYLPVGLLYFLFSPFPWQVLSLKQGIALPDVLLFYYLFPKMVRGLVWLVRNRLRESSTLILMTVTISTLYALVEGNVGIIFRHRAQVLLPLIIFAAVGITLRREALEAGGAGGSSGSGR